MKIRYIKEGYIKTVDKMKDSLDKKLTAEDIRKHARETILPEIRHALYISLYKNFKETDDNYHEDNICKSYKIRGAFGDPLDISFRIPNLSYAWVREDMNSATWNKEIYNLIHPRWMSSSSGILSFFGSIARVFRRLYAKSI